MYKFFLLSTIFITSCSVSTSDSGADRTSCATSFESAFVSYSVEFNATWSDSTHPDQDFPSNPHFSPLVGSVHSSAFSMWNTDLVATPGMKLMAETGATSTLEAEVEAQVGLVTACATVLAAGPISVSPGSLSVEFETTKDFPLLSLVSMVAPSPDWFVGIHDLSLLDGAGEWKSSIEVELFSYDAGTDDGEDYTSDNVETSPAENISELLADPFTEDEPLGTFTLTKL